jgi:hypothetical protein
MANLLATFDLKPVTDSDGNEVPPRFELTVGLSRYVHIL